MRNSLLILALATTSAFGQNDAEYATRIKKYTTEPFFLTELVDHLPSSSTVPSPMKHFGDIIGAPNVLHHVDEINAYMRALDKASDRIIVQSMGKSEGGREMIAVIISDAANLNRLDRIKEINAQLGDPRKLVNYKSGNDLTAADEKADQLAAEGLPIYYATGGMHSPESGPPEMLMELAYRLVVEESPVIQEIRKNSIVILTPVLDVDGRDRYVDTYLYRKQNPTKPAIPLLYWGKYVAHDNNRDNIGMSLALSKNLMTTWLQYHPTVLHDLHESVPFLYISTGTGPYNAWLDPMTIDEWHTMAYYEVSEMTKRGVPGVWTHGFYDGWAPNYAFYVANGHNAIGRFYETQGGSGADTRVINIGDQSNRDWFRPNPPLSSVRWSIRNNTNLMQSALLLGMHNVASHKTQFLKDYYLKSKRSVLKPWNEGPSAYVMMAKNGKTWNLEELRILMGRQGVEVTSLQEDFKDGETTYPKGSLVVRMDQPYSRMADMLLDRQYYNRNDPSPYDDTGWTLGPLFDVATARVKDKSILSKTADPTAAHFEPAKPFPVEKSKLGRVALVHTWQSTQDEGWVRLAFDAAGVPFKYVSVHELRDTQDLKSKYDVIILSPTRGSAQSIVSGISTDGEPIPWKPLPGFPHLGGEDNSDNIRGGIELQGVVHLQKFVKDGGLLICMSGTCSLPIQFGLVSGVTMTEPRELFAPGGVFLTENSAKESPIMSGYSDTLGVYFSTAPLLSLGGGGFGGRRGGGAASGRPSGRGGLDDPDTVQGRAPYTAKSDPTDAQDPTPPPAGSAPQVLLRFAAADKLLISGALDKGEELAGKAALIRCPVGKGNVLLFAINPMWRQSTHGSWALVFNAIANWKNLSPAKK